jgi:hypothetical protein
MLKLQLQTRYSEAYATDINLGHGAHLVGQMAWDGEMALMFLVHVLTGMRKARSK